jgi:hypothetical protein
VPPCPAPYSGKGIEGAKEEYEWADRLSPEDRENICRIFGKFAHVSKRRVLIDTYFIIQSMELAYKCENDLPTDILEKAMEFEKAEKFNPPIERRAKAISTAELERSLKKNQQDAAAKGISIDERKLAQGLNDVPLCTTE